MGRGSSYQEEREEETAFYHVSSSTTTNVHRHYDTITIESDSSFQHEDDAEDGVIILHSSSAEINASNQDSHTLSKTLMLGLAFSVGFASMDISLYYRLMNLIGDEFQQTDLAPWIHGAYLLCGLTTLPLAGNLADTFGRKPVLLTFSLIFLVGSWATGISRGVNQVIFARAIAGIGGGGLHLMGNVTVHDQVPLERRGPYQACITMAQTLGLALGSPLGHLIHEKWGWRYCFALNTLPLLLSICLFYVCLEHPSTSTKSWQSKLKSIDFVGTGFLSLCSITLVTCLLLGGTNPRDPRIITMVSLSAVSFLILGLYEYYCYHNYGNTTPHMPAITSVFGSKRNVILACIGMFLACLTDGIMYLMPYYFEGVAGLKTGEADAWFLIETLAVPVGCGVAGYTIHRTGTFRTKLVVYGMLSTVGILLLGGWMVSGISWPVGIIAMACVGFAMGNILVSLYMATVSEIQASEMTLAMVIVVMAHFMAYCVGITVSSSIVQRHLKAHLPQRVGEAGAEELIRLIRTHIQRIHTLSPEVQAVVADVLGQSLQKAFFWMAGSMVLASLMFALMRNVNLKPSSSLF